MSKVLMISSDCHAGALPGMYEAYMPERMEVIPPGVDLSRFSPPDPSWSRPAISDELARFLADPNKPMVLALARAEERKNFEGLVRAFAGNLRTSVR